MDGGGSRGEAEPRETSGVTTGLIVRYVRDRGGEPAVARLLDRAGTSLLATDLEDEARWTSYDTRIRLFRAAVEVLDDPDAPFRIGAVALTSGLNHSLVLLVRAMGSPRQVFRQLPRAVPKFSTTSTMEIVEAGATHATVRYRLHEGYRHSRLDCRYAQGLFSMVPRIFGLPPARIVHDECQSDGYPACLYHLTWQQRSRLPWRRGRPDDAELVALRGQLQALQSAASDLVSSDSLEEVLQRITERAAAAVLAPGYLLAVTAPDGRATVVHSPGVEPERARQLATALLEGRSPGPEAVVVDVASSRRVHGRLAALYAAGTRGMVDERSLLSAYAGHAAAALDLLVALEGSRREAARARALLDLSHDLARAGDATAVAAAATAALPDIVGCTRATALLWEPDAGRLRGAAAAGWSFEQHAAVLGTTICADDVPELPAMLVDPGPLLLTAGTVPPSLRAALTGLDVTDVLAVPLLAGDAPLGVLTAGWDAGTGPAASDDEVLLRLRSVGDQAATALQNARLLDTVRHQALHDALTGLPNRVLFADRLAGELAAAGPRGSVAVLFCDLDRFKEVNDTGGHAAGDELLRQVAARLRAAVRPGDVVGRLSGDEFAVLLPGAGETDVAPRLAERVVAAMRRPFRLGGQDVHVTTSVGIATHTGPGGDGDHLLRAADTAMYAAKQRGRNQVATAEGPAYDPAPAMFTSQDTPNLSTHIPKVSPHGALSNGMVTVPSRERPSQ